MNALALAGTAFGSLAVGAVAAGWLMVLTPVPTRPIPPSPTFVRETLASSSNVSSSNASTGNAEAVSATPARPPISPPIVAASTSDFVSTVPRSMTAQKAPSAAHAPRKVLAAPLLATRPRTPIIAAVKRRLAKVAALVLPARVAPKPASKPVAQADHRYDNVLTASQIGRIKASLRLSSDQEPYWPRVAEMLRAVGRRQMAAAASGGAPSFGSSGDLMQFYFAAQPLLRSLRDDQKAEVRRLAHRMGFGAVDSYI